MKHLIICPEYPPSPRSAGGIGIYVSNIAHLLSNEDEIVHIIGEISERAPRRLEELNHGKLIVHRVDSHSSKSLLPETKLLLRSEYPPRAFSWEAAGLAEKLVKEEGIDIIEAQEFEAPLYYFQLRRMLGLGPDLKPPCFVHLHSPTEYIARYNDNDSAQPYYKTALTLELTSIRAADGLLCPSQELAIEMETKVNLPGGITVIRYPVGDFSLLQRSEDVWRNGSICYVGRLEPRKGIHEWLDVAVEVAKNNANIHFDFLGANVLHEAGKSRDEILLCRIPDELRNKFHFRGQIAHSDMPNFLSNARIAVIPSRWDNFPNTCMEAMAGGLPVLATDTGGLSEMIEDGKTGWLIKNPGKAGFLEALDRALKCTPDQLAAMGRAASFAIKESCDNRRILEQQMEFRRRLVMKKASRSLHFSGDSASEQSDIRFVQRKRSSIETNIRFWSIVLRSSFQRRVKQIAIFVVNQFRGTGIRKA